MMRKSCLTVGGYTRDRESRQMVKRQSPDCRTTLY